MQSSVFMLWANSRMMQKQKLIVLLCEGEKLEQTKFAGTLDKSVCNVLKLQCLASIDRALEAIP